MNLTEDKLAALPQRNGFRMRGEAMTRMEVFSDAAFAFAVTTLVVSVGSIPGSYEELLFVLKKVPAFALSFAQIAAFWIAHRSWSRRYGLENTWTTGLTLLMIFTILVYVFPLRLIFSTFCGWASGGWLPQEYTPDSAWEVQGLFAIYGVGFSALGTILALLFYRSLKAKAVLQLSEEEVLMTKHGIHIWSIQAATGIVSTVWALTLPTVIAVHAGFIYFLIPIAMAIVTKRYRTQASKREKHLEVSEDEI